jgi:DNA polymerase III delta' subunit
VSDQSIWDMVVGHDEAVAMLKEVVAGERVTHAWLFTGPPGIGKLHTARVFAAALNCPAGGDGTCDSCRRILRGVHPDVHLIVPEGDNLLVEDVRAVREEASLTHYEAPTAVFILDEADRLTEAAANALLKVLEEPPPQVVFVLVARSAEALVDTVPSRARTLPFVSLSLAELTAALGDDLQLDRDQTTWAAAASHGRLARARALLTDEAARTRRSTPTPWPPPPPWSTSPTRSPPRPGPARNASWPTSKRPSAPAAAPAPSASAWRPATAASSAAPASTPSATPPPTSSAPTATWPSSPPGRSRAAGRGAPGPHRWSTRTRPAR